MKLVYTAQDSVSAQLIKDYLAESAIDSIVKGELLIGAVGELPASSFPTVWVVDDNDFESASELVKSYERGFKDQQLYNNVWKCEFCDELIEAQFTQCWKCGYERESS